MFEDYNIALYFKTLYQFHHCFQALIIFRNSKKATFYQKNLLAQLIIEFQRLNKSPEANS